MLSTKLRQLFKKWKLYEKEWVFYTTVCYENPSIRVERIYKKWDKQVYSFLLDIFFEHEYYGQKITTRDLGELTWLDHSSIVKLTNRAIKQMREEYDKNYSPNISPKE